MKKVSTRKQLAVELSKLKQIKGVKRGLEQYQTDSELGASILWDAFMLGDIEGNALFDLGAGNGIFGIGAKMLGAKQVIFVEKDPEAAGILKDNLGKSEELMTVIELDIEHADFSVLKDFKEVRKVVIMNPPFGTKQKHADRMFLDKAMDFAEVIYSIHIAESLDFIKALSKDRGFEVSKVWVLEFGIKKSHVMHRKAVHKVKVLCVRLTKDT